VCVCGGGGVMCDRCVMFRLSTDKLLRMRLSERDADKALCRCVGGCGGGECASVEISTNELTCLQLIRAMQKQPSIGVAAGVIGGG
jgi:hypothetical protein